MPKKSTKKVPKVVLESKQPVAPHHHRRRWSLVVPTFSFLLLIFAIALAVYLRYFSYSLSQQYATNTPASDSVASSGSSSGSTGTAVAPETKTSSDMLSVVKTASFGVTVKDASDAIQKITTVAKDQKGSVVLSFLSEQQSSCTSGIEPAYDMKLMMYPSSCYDALITIRVPVASYDAARAAVQKVDENAKFDSESVQETDVTTQAADLQTMLASYQSEQAALQKLLDSAKNVDDILKIRTQLTQVQTQVQSLQQQIRDLGKNVQYAHLTVSISELSSEEVATPSVSGRFSVAWAAMKQDISNIGTALIFVAVYAVVYVPVLAVLLILFWLLKRAVHRHAKKS